MPFFISQKNKMRIQIETTIHSKKWYFLCCTFDRNAENDNAKMYFNGILQGKTDWTLPLEHYKGPLNIGCYQNQSGGARYRGYFNGVIDEVMIFNRTLSATEVKRIYNAQK